MDTNDPTQQVRALLEAAPDAMVIFDRDGRIVRCNTHAASLFGYKREELYGLTVEVLIPERFRAVHLSHRRHYSRMPRQRPMGAAEAELWGRRRDGTEFIAEISLSPFESPEGSFVISAIRDGTARRRAYEQFRRLLEAVPDAVVVSRRDGTITFVNAQAESVFGYRRDELLGKKVELLVPERHRAVHPSHRHAFFSAPQARPLGTPCFALSGQRKNGTEFPAEISLSSVETDEGLVAITSVQDITERLKAAQEAAKLAQAVEAIELRDEFLSVASHELRTPLSALLMQVDSMRRMLERLPEPLRSDPHLDRLDHKVKLIRASVIRTNELIGQLLDVSRVTAGRLDLSVKSLDASAVVREVAARFEDEFSRAGCQLELRTDAPAPVVWDPLRIEQVLANLLTNALKYGGGKPIALSVTQPTERLTRIVVRDRGIGIAPEHHARIFDRFERVATRSSTGFGLGLWISRQIVEAHRGTIRVFSEPDAGSEFTIDLPMDAGPPDDRSTQPG